MFMEVITQQHKPLLAFCTRRVKTLTSNLLQDLKCTIIRSVNSPLRPLVTNRRTAGQRTLVALKFGELKVA